MTLFIIAVYMALVLAVGALSHRMFRGTGEDYFLATRSIGPFVLLMSLFGTQMTAFALLGKPLRAGNWSGNDTLWRAIVDLNRIAACADRDGRLTRLPADLRNRLEAPA